MQTKRFGTFEGVFIPCLLSILGVIMYLRLGWVVGQVGLTGALVIICFSNVITILTAFSMSSIVTNIRIGVGGAYSIITKSLGIEVGGAIGIPLYLSQAVSVGFYITGFTECWVAVFPHHNFLGVSLTLWLILLIIAYMSAKLAFRIQYVIVGLIGLSLVSIAFGQDAVAQNPPLLTTIPMDNFWVVFAIFFPAVTGVLAGATMSGELVDPKKSIPGGTFGAIIVSFVVYLALAIWFATHVSADQLVNNTSVIIEASRWKWMVVAGIMGATLSSALNMLVASPRTLVALGKHEVIPLSKHFTRINKGGEPSTAVLFTAFLVLLTILGGTLDQVAGLLTMFFLITYGMINLSVFIEQSIGIASFRPTIRVPRFVPLLGSVSCVLMMFLINVKFTLAAICTIIIIYTVLLRREVRLYSPDVRSGLLIFIAEQFAKAAAKLPYHPKIWKPNLLIPVDNIEEFKKIIPFVWSIVYPSGRVIAFKVLEDEHVRDYHDNTARENMQKIVEKAVEPLKSEEVFLQTAVLESPDTLTGSVAAIQTVENLYFKSNTLLCNLSANTDGDEDLKVLIKKAEDEGLGVLVIKLDEKVGLAQEEVINIWIRQQSPNIDLSVLVSLQLEKNWNGRVRIVQVVKSSSEVEEARVYIRRLLGLIRLRPETEIEVLVGEDFRDVIKSAPPADINIFGMPKEPDLTIVREVSKAIKTSVIFLRDSEHESAIA